ncbi:MAG: hypothetical protein P4K86_12250 [Terracidiphilus sp.]|nr:hypothetical protein [Terracidiphilus sp.]MDR3777316.1 hypothetical protein [Terracidiphilus sp.]
MSNRLTPNQITLLAETGAIVLALLALGWLKTQPLTFTAFGPADVLNRLTPLILTAGIIERSVEVLISPWRDPEANRHATAIAAAKAAPEPDDQAKAQKVQTVADATDSLTVYTGVTQRYAFITGLTLGLIASLAGISAFMPFLANGKDALNALPAAQHALFSGFDIVLTAALLAGGADGLHSVISAFTSFFGATAQRVSNPS